MRRNCDRVIAKAKELFSRATVSFNFIGAVELLELINKQPQKFYPLTLSETPISPRGQKAWICLVPIVEYYKFITDENGQIKNELFEANVRDWEGENIVNEGIRHSLEDKPSQREEDFWWLNNGITILASSAANQGGQVLSVEAPLIVNGLQTSRCIFNYVSTLGKHADESRNVLVRVIAAEQAQSTDHIIKATNSQTIVPLFRLHMTEDIHRHIEILLRSHSLFYDRRKNYYKNDNRPIVRIVQPLNLAQAIMSIVLQKPDDARARPTTLLKGEYDNVFNTGYPLQLFANCALLMKKVEQFLLLRDLAITRNDRLNLRWYLTMEYARALTGSDTPTAADLSSLTIPADDKLLKAAYMQVKAAYLALGGTDKVAKGPDLTLKLKAMPPAHE